MSTIIAAPQPDVFPFNLAARKLVMVALDTLSIHTWPEFIKVDGEQHLELGWVYRYEYRLHIQCDSFGNYTLFVFSGAKGEMCLSLRYTLNDALITVIHDARKTLRSKNYEEDVRTLRMTEAGVKAGGDFEELERIVKTLKSKHYTPEGNVFPIVSTPTTDK